MTYVGTAIVGIALASSLFAQESKGTAGTAALQGTWVITSMNGKPAPEGAPELTVTFKGNTYQQALGGEVNERGTIKVDTSKKPMAIDFAIADGADAGKTQLGVIEVSGDTLRANLDTPGAGKRPVGFTVQEGSILFVGKKKKP